MPINKALHIMMLTLLVAAAPHAAHAQRATAAASAKITTQQFSTKEFRTNANDQEVANIDMKSGVTKMKDAQKQQVKAAFQPTGR
jgi:hypothetical protein